MPVVVSARGRMTACLLLSVSLAMPSLVGAQKSHAALDPSPASPAHDGTPRHGAKRLECRALATLSLRGLVQPAGAIADTASFVDRTVHRLHHERVRVGCRSYVAPFVTLDARFGAITIGHESNLQDNVTVIGRGVVIGDRVSIAHNATLTGNARIGAPGGLPAFVGFNSVVDSAVVEPDAMVTHLVKVAPGIIIRAGTKVLPGKWIRTQAEADDPALGKVVAVTDDDRAFMHGVLHVNTAFASGYAALAKTAPMQLRGAGRDPGDSDFNHHADQPSFAGRAQPHPTMSLRVIGDVTMRDGWRTVQARTGRDVSIRADEGEHFRFGTIGRVHDHVTFHALEHTNLEIGNGIRFGEHVVVHGGPDDASLPRDITSIGDKVLVGDWAVVFRSKIGAGVEIGAKAYIDGCHLAPGTIVPAGTIMIKDKVMGRVEW